MGFVLTEAGTVSCGSGGKATLKGSAKLTVNGADAAPDKAPKVLRLADLTGANIVGCPADKPQAGTTQCRSAAATGGAEKLTVGREPVILDTVKVTSEGVHPPVSPSTTPSGSLSTDAGQARLSAR